MVPEPGASRTPPPTALARLWQVLRVAIVVWLGLIAFLALVQRSMIYYPSHQDAASLERDALAQGFEPWRDNQGATIGYRSLAPAEDPRPPLAMVLLHGNAGHAMHRADYAKILRLAAPDRAVSLYVLEYPGYGARDGEPSQEAFLAAASGAVSLIPAEMPLVLLGESIGTGVAAATASAHPERVRGLMLLTPFDSLASVAQHHYPLLPVRWIMRDQYPSAEWLKHYGGPVAVVLAAKDTVVPTKFGRKLYDTYSGPKTLVVDEQADHNDILLTLRQEDWEKTLAFLLGRQSGPD